MDFAHSPRAADYLTRVRRFIQDEIRPVERGAVEGLLASADVWSVMPAVEELKAKAKAEGLWNLFLPPVDDGGEAHGPGLTNVEYAPLAEAMGASLIAAEVFNCSAPDTGNAEVLLQYGTPEQKQTWLAPLLDGRIRSAFCMTEPAVASSDATNMEATAIVDGSEIVLNGRKWWSTGVGHPDCNFAIYMGVTDPEAHKYARHSMVLVPMDSPGVKVERLLPTMNFYDEPHGHGEVRFTDVRLPVDAALGGPGKAFEIAQNRLGPGRVHHCMRLIGLAEYALALAIQRGVTRTAFGKPIINLGGNRERIAHARNAIDQARLLVLRCAWQLDTEGLVGALQSVSQIKAVVPKMAQDVIDMAMQLHGGGGLSNDFPLAGAWANARALRLADGPDEVHLGVVARIELKGYPREDLTW
jgi:acyl-CoA dehydrogenase